MNKTAILLAMLVLMGAAVANKSHSKSKTLTERKSPSELLIEHLDGIEGRLRGEQIQDNEIHDAQAVECTAEKENRAQAIQEASDALKRAQNHYVRCDSSLHQTRADLAQIKKFITEIKFNQQALKVNREREAQDLDDLLNKEIEPSLANIQQAYPIIDELGTSEVSLAEVTHKMTGLFMQLAGGDNAALMAPLLNALVQVTEGNFSEADIEQIRRLFETLEQDLVQVKNDAMRIEEERKQVYADTIAQYNELLDGLSAKQRSLEAYESQMIECVTVEQGVIDASSAKLRQNKQALAYAITMCDAFETQYQNSKSARSRELELLAKLKNFVNERSEVFGNYGAENHSVFAQYKKQYEDKADKKVESFLEQRRLKLQSDPAFLESKIEELKSF